MKQQPTVSGMHVFLVMFKAFHAVQEIDRESIKQLELGSHSDFVILEILFHKGATPINTIAKKVGLTSGSATTAVDRAEKKGYVKRVYCPNDRRKVYAELTELGKRTIEEKMPKHAAMLESAMGGLDDDERTAFINLLKKMGYYAQENFEDIITQN